MNIVESKHVTTKFKVYKSVHHHTFQIKQPTRCNSSSSLLLGVYTGCPGENVPDFGRLFLRLKYTDITQNTYIRSWTVTEIMATEKCSHLAVPRTVSVSRDVLATATTTLEPETAQHNSQNRLQIRN